VKLLQKMEDLVMKTARRIDGTAIDASMTAPRLAICPWCGGKVTLRHRQLMNEEGRIYYWRHQSNRHLGCQGRARPLHRRPRLAT